LGLRKAAALHLRPRLAAVRALPQRTARAAALQEVRTTHTFPARGEQHVRVARMDRDVHEAGLVADELHQPPRLPAVRRLVEPTLRVGAPDRTQSGDPD